MTKSALRNLASIAAAGCLVLGIETWADTPGEEKAPPEKPAGEEKAPPEKPAGEEFQFTNAEEFEILIRRVQMRRLRNPRPRLPDASAVVTCLARDSAAADPAVDGCRFAESVSRMQPCLDFDNCPAYDAWRQLYDQERPQIVPAVPRAPNGRPMAVSVRPRDDE